MLQSIANVIDIHILLMFALMLSVLVLRGYIRVSMQFNVHSYKLTKRERRKREKKKIQQDVKDISDAKRE